MIKILSGVLRPDEGVVRIKGDEVDSRASPRRAGARSRTVFQELTLMPWMTVAENLLIGKEPRGPLRADPAARAPRPSPPRSSRGYGVQRIDPLELVAALPLAQRQMLEIVRALLLEPRDPLPRRAHLGARRARGRVALRPCARAARARHVRDLHVAPLGRGGRTWPTASPSSATASTSRRARAIERERGGDADDRPHDRPHVSRAAPCRPTPPSRSRSRDLRRAGQWTASRFELRRGEILGIGGLAGQGQRDLFMTLFGARKATGGEIRVGGKPGGIRKPGDAIRRRPRHRARPRGPQERGPDAADVRCATT